MKPIDWENSRRPDGTIDLVGVYVTTAERLGTLTTVEAIGYLADVELIRPVHSRQVAAVAVAMALTFRASLV